MVRPPSVDSKGMKKGAWSEDEDNKLRAYVMRYGHWNWRLLPKFAGLARCGKSCRLRWVNYLKPGLKKGDFSKEEEDLIIKLHAQLGNRWSAIAAQVHGRTDNEIKNFYHTRIEKHRKRNPSVKKVPQHSPSEPSSQNQGLEGEKAFEFTQYYQETRDESSISKAQESTVSIDNNSTTSFAPSSEDQEGSWPDLFQIDTNYNQIDNFPDPQFFNSELHYSELSSSESSYMSALDWIADDDHHSNICSEYVAASSNYQSETGFEEPLFHCFDYGMDLFN